MAGAPAFQLQYDKDQFSDLPSIRARIDRQERWRTNHRYGDLDAPGLQAVLDAAAKGDVADWADLAEFAITTDAHVFGLYVTRIARVAQADYIVAPSDFGNPTLAMLAAEFVDEEMGRLTNFRDAACELLHAIALGYSASEMLWARDAVTRTNYVERIDNRHPHRFRYGLQWDLRLFDHGKRRGPIDAQGYGETLDPRTFIVHTHKEVAGYPGIAGTMRPTAWRWMFTRWVEKFWIAHIEKFGSPFVYSRVAKGTPQRVRDEVLTSLENLSSDHAAVFEQGGEIVFEAAASAAKGDEAHDRYVKAAQASMTSLWLGTSDATGPGVNGTQGAVTARISAAMDPRMVSDGNKFASMWRRTYMTRVLIENAHKFGPSIGQVPVPELKLKTADDEAKRDPSGLQDEQQAQAAAGNPAPSKQDDSYDVQGDPGMGPIDPAPPTAPAPKAASDPKARALALSRGRSRGQTTRRTSSRLPSPLALALRGELVASVSSSSNPSPKPSKP